MNTLFEIMEFEDITPFKSAVEVKRGDIWQCGVHRIMCADATNIHNINKLMQGNKPDLVFADPPYGINIAGKHRKIGADVLAKCQIYKPVLNDNTTNTAKSFYDLIKNYKIIIWGGNYFLDFLEKNGSWLVWNKINHGCNFAEGELAWTNIKTRLKIYDFLWRGMLRCEREKRLHPTQKPVSLLSAILKDFSNANDIVLDGFLGSGSTLIACEKTNRICYGIEIDEYYCKIIIERFKQFTGKSAIKIN